MAWQTTFTTKRTVRVGDVDLHVGETGSGPPIVFLHGNPDTHTVWARIAQDLPAARCIAPDLPGFGASTAPTTLDMSLDGQAELVRGLVAELELDRFHLVCHDVGGVFGLAFATLHPQRLQSLTVFNTIFWPDYKWHFWARVWRTRGLGESAMAVANRPLFVRELRRGSPAMPPDYADLAYREFHKGAKTMALRWYRAMDPEVWSGWDLRMAEALRTIPTRVVWGDADPFIQPTFADRIPGTVTHTPHGHWVMLEDPALAVKTISEQVARNPT